MLHTIQKITKISSTILLSLFALNANALHEDSAKPLNVVSQEQLADFNSNKAIFIGNVIATQGSIEVKADKAELIRNKDGKLQEVKAYGKPATFKQLQDNNKVIRSQSAIIQYIPEKNLVILIGRATIWQDNSHVNGERIEYNTITKQLKASNENNQGGRVQSTFIPQELKTDSNK